MTRKARNPSTPRRKDRFRSLRIGFSYEGTELRLVSRDDVDVKATPSDAIDYPKGQSGFWIELQDQEGRTLYRRVMQNPIRFAAEFPTGDPDTPLCCESIDEPRGTFSLLLPILEKAHTLVLFSSPHDPDTAPATEIGRFGLTNDESDERTR